MDAVALEKQKNKNAVNKITKPLLTKIKSLEKRIERLEKKERSKIKLAEYPSI